MIKRIDFEAYSKAHAIYKNSLNNSPIETISLPESLTKLGEGWCNHTYQLTSIKISPSNTKFHLFENQLLVGKSNDESDDYDVLLAFVCKTSISNAFECDDYVVLHFSRRDMNETSIPSNIKVIAADAFGGFWQLRKVEIQNDSSLQTIGNMLFPRIFNRITKKLVK